ncbi:hypothetical protein [Novosphingobium sp. B 225]|uniref:hypothetical protein n=1 Tax=Novosphingobium sp. B 225 TaxID=1961849 RepID=UPI0015962B8E|nr:hypothetical protein [Novosphingobium sp. B 225]
MTLRRALCLILSLSIAGPALAAPAQLLREQRAVTLGGAAETWQLVWQGRPRSICGPEDVEMAITCPCTGFAYGELGKLDLVRLRGGKVVDRMDLGPLFSDLPADDADGLAAMQWRQMVSRDFDAAADGSSKAFLAEVAKRPGPRMMRLADYDHDGVASEFLVQVSAGPCGHTEYAAVGVSKAQPKLHALSSKDNPASPLVLPGSAWQALLGPKPRTVVNYPCGDHGADQQEELVVGAAGGTISVQRVLRACSDEGGAGAEVGREAM